MEARPLTWLVAVLVLVACSRSKNPTSTGPATVSSDAASVPTASASKKASQPDIDLSTVEIRLDRTECAGWCPNYSVVISGNGHVHYIGRSFVSVVGEDESTLSQDSVRALLRQFEKVKFADLGDAYRQNVTDCPSAYLTLRLDGRTKRVENYWTGRPTNLWGEEVKDRAVHEQLNQLAKAIDDAVLVEQWIGSEDERRDLREKLPAGRWGRMESK